MGWLLETMSPMALRASSVDACLDCDCDRDDDLQNESACTPRIGNNQNKNSKGMQ